MSTDLIEFLNIKDKFISFLNDKNCLYKYLQYYTKTINESIINESIEKQIEDQLINYILFIKKEGTTCCCNNVFKINSKNEAEIITESLKLLAKFKSSI